MASIFMLCVVMLTAAALTLLALPQALMPAAARKPALQVVRGTGPPHEWQFSAIRC